MFFMKRRGHRLVVRDEQDGYDFTLTDFTIDNNWHDLDLSGIVDKGSIAALIHVTPYSTDGAATIYLSKKGFTEPYIASYHLMQFMTPFPFEALVALDPVTGKCQYKLGTGTWVYINVSVLSWFV